MKTLFLATAAVLGLGVGVAFAGEGEGPHANTWFTELPGVVAQAPVQAPSSAFAQAPQQAPSGAPTAAFVTGHNHTVSLFPPNGNEGANN
ncbi:MAG: hypothetical protein WDN25_14490 [Acetobacteraceae bacterium]